MTQVLMAMHIAHLALRRNTLRSTLTMLGVIIGVAAVIAMLAIGQGAQAVIRAQIASLGSHSLIVQPGSTSQSGVRYGWGSRTTLRVPDVQAILKECPAIAYATPSLRGGFQVVYANQNWPTAVQGTGVEYLNIFDWPLASGEWFTSQDIDAASKVAVLGDTVREMLFGSVDPVGQVMQIKNMPFRVIGVLEPKGQSAWGQDQDDIIFVPYTTAQKKVIGTSVDLCHPGRGWQQCGTAAGHRANHRPAAPAAPFAALAGKRFFGATPGCYGRCRGREYACDDPPAGEYCLDLAAGGRHWHYEYHAGLGDRAHP